MIAKVTIFIVLIWSGISTDIKPENLAKKWTLEKYPVFFQSYSPEENELNDYLELLIDRSYQSISEGKYEDGTWRLTDHRLSLYSRSGKNMVNFIIEDLYANKLVLTIDDPVDQDTAYLQIHFKTH